MPTDERSEADEQPWVAHGSCTSEHEDFLIGNRAGLELLKQKVDAALESGECRIEEGSVDFVGIRLVERDPRTGADSKPGGLKDAAGLLGCALLALAIIMVFLAGLFQIVSWMK